MEDGSRPDLIDGSEIGVRSTETAHRLKHKQRNSTHRGSLIIPWPDIGRFAEAIMLAQRELLAAAKSIRDEFSLGPRGTWILGLIATGRIKTQADVVRRYKVGRSMIAEEIALLAKAGLINCEPHESDRRQVALSLTGSGIRANARMGEAMAARMSERLDRYTLGDLLFCTGLLEDLARAD
jgi:DNA-binding MarR family transcriptional regulator